MSNLFGAGRVQGACDVSYESQCPCHGCAECWRGVSAAFWARRRKTGGSHASKRHTPRNLPGFVLNGDRSGADLRTTQVRRLHLVR